MSWANTCLNKQSLAPDIDGRHQEWVVTGQYAGVKSLLDNSGPNLRLELPITGHGKSAVDNLRKKRKFSHAIKQLVVQGLHSNAFLQCFRAGHTCMTIHIYSLIYTNVCLSQTWRDFSCKRGSRARNNSNAAVALMTI